MSLLGVYPFTVYVANIIDPGRKVGIKVTHYHHRGYYTWEEGNKKFVIDTIQANDGEYTIPGGYRLGFPMLIGDEYLEISLDEVESGVIPDLITVAVGAKAKCYPTYNETPIPPLPSSSFGEGQDIHGIYYRGGKWELDQSKASWKMIIRKYGPDPEDENVTVGEESPG
ncbi:MAG: hypothetical protein JSV88_04690 [Candidatus Aminicenantes bacterium]|nr:MAG: hypothetical protein JSV88_04690 [Candidatus Aminicenantes bacterium]